MMELLIPDSLSNSLREIGKIGGKHVYLVGGSVRDLLLKRPCLDIDIVVEGDAISVAKKLQEQWNGTLQTHPQFGTATVTPENPDKPKVDFVSARSETYQKPATLPKVERGTITQDLLRRDFTINALAMRLDFDGFGTIIDKTDGLKDLKTGTIRVIHNNSYTDDPTRIFRANRYAGRYNFQISGADKKLIHKAIHLISQLSGERIRNEIENVITEDNAPKIVELINEFDVFENILHGWNIPSDFPNDFNTAQFAILWGSENILETDLDKRLIFWFAFFGLGNEHSLPIHVIEALSFKLVLEHQLRKISNIRMELSDEEEIRHGIENIGISLSKKTSFEFYNGKWCIVDYENEKTLIYGDTQFYRVQTPNTAFRRLHHVIGSLQTSTAPSGIYQLLRPFPLEAVVLAFRYTNISATQRKKIGSYLLKLRGIKPIINGDDLIKWGEKPGKNFERLLKDIFHDQLDGKIITKSDGNGRYQQLKNQESN